MIKNLLVLGTLTLALSVTAQQTKKPLQPTDVFRIPTLSDADVSPDGKWVIYSLSEVDTAKDGRVSHLWMQSWDGKASLQLTYGDEAASSPKFSPDGKYISFISSRESKKGAQVWLMDRRGGEGKKLTDIKGSIEDYSWSHDAQKLLLTIEDPENGGKPDPKTALPIKIDRYHFKQDVAGYLQHLHNHLYIFDLATKKLDTLSRGNYDERQAEWSPDGKQVVFVSNRTADPDKNENSDIFVIDAKPGAQMQQLTTWNGPDGTPHWSPDSKYICYSRSTSDANYMMYDQSILCLMDADGKNNRLLTAQLDRPAGGAAWSKDGKNIGFLVSDDRMRYAASVDISVGQITTLLKGKFSIGDIAAIPGGNWLIQMSDPYTPAELYGIENGAARRLTFNQQTWLSTVNLSHV